MYKNKHKGLTGIIITVAILVVLVIVSNIKVDKWSNIGNGLTSIFLPVQTGFSYLKNKVSGNNKFFYEIDSLKEENESLKKKNSELEKKSRELEIIKAENESLKEYVNLKDKYSEYTTVPAQVIQRDITNYSKNIIINMGKNDGIEVNMVVISDKGLVGHVIYVDNKTAKVQTIIDPSSAVSGTITSSRDGIIIRGMLDNNNIVKATYIPTDATIIEGDNIETSGIGGIYPKGIHIGSIKQIMNSKNITDRYAEVETAVEFSKLETVLVITNK